MQLTRCPGAHEAARSGEGGQGTTHHTNANVDREIDPHADVLEEVSRNYSDCYSSM